MRFHAFPLAVAVSVTLAACAGPGEVPQASTAPAARSTPQRPVPRVAQGVTPTPQVILTDEMVWVVTATQELVQFRAVQPDRVLQRRPLSGLAAGETVLGIDFRTTPRGPVLYAWSSAGRLYMLDTASAVVRPVSPREGSGVLPNAQVPHGVDVDPVQDQVRVVDATGRNVRIDPNTGTAIDADPNRDGLQTDGRLVFAQRDWNAEATPQLVASAHSYNAAQRTGTAFAIDRSTGNLVSQGSREGARPVVSPNLGRLYTVGALGLGPLQDAAFDIAPRSQAALAAIRTAAEPRTGLYHIDLNTGHARWVGWVGDGIEVRGLAIEP